MHMHACQASLCHPSSSVLLCHTFSGHVPSGTADLQMQMQMQLVHEILQGELDSTQLVCGCRIQLMTAGAPQRS